MQEAPLICMLYIILIIALIAIDQAVKLFISSHMMLGAEIPVIDGFFSITYIHNTGAAFGILAGHIGFLLVLTGIMIGVVCIYLIVKRKSIHKLSGTALALIVSGGVGNVIDRSVYGYVIDFLDFKVWNPIFNIADIAVCVGCGLMIIYVLFFDRKESR